MPAILPSDGITLKFTDHPSFKPHYTPRDILLLGAFRGGYFFRRRGLVDPDSELFKFLDPLLYQRDPEEDTVNFFGVAAVVKSSGLPHSIKKQYPGGFFTWYCLYYYMGIGKVDAPWFVEYWKNSVKDLYTYVASDPTNLFLNPAHRQAMLELGWDSTKNPNSE